MLSLTVRTKRTDIGGCKTQTSVDFDSIDDTPLDSRSVTGINGFSGTIYDDYVVMSIGYDGNVRVTKAQMVAILKGLEDDCAYQDLIQFHSQD